MGRFSLEFQKVTKMFYGLCAVNKLNFHIEEGEILSLIGPNGAGKTTIFNMISGMYVPTEGKIIFKNRLINNLKAHVITNIGIARTFQNIRLFQNMTSLDNVRIGGHCRVKGNLLGSIFNSSIIRKEEEKKMNEKADELLEFTKIYSYREELAKNLPYGIQRRLELARALATEPTLILLDEPTAGMNPRETEDLMVLIKRIRDLKFTIFLVEHDMKVVRGISDRVIVLNYGEKIAEGTYKEIQSNNEVIKAYLGKRGNFNC